MPYNTQFLLLHIHHKKSGPLFSLYFSNMVNWISPRLLTVFLTTWLQYFLKTFEFSEIFWIWSARVTLTERPRGMKDEVKSPKGPPARTRSQGPEGSLTSSYDHNWYHYHHRLNKEITQALASTLSLLWPSSPSSSSSSSILSLSPADQRNYPGIRDITALASTSPWLWSSSSSYHHHIIITIIIIIFIIIVCITITIIIITSWSGELLGH